MCEFHPGLELNQIAPDRVHKQIVVNHKKRRCAAELQSSVMHSKKQRKTSRGAATPNKQVMCTAKASTCDHQLLESRAISQETYQRMIQRVRAVFEDAKNPMDNPTSIVAFQLTLQSGFVSGNDLVCFSNVSREARSLLQSDMSWPKTVTFISRLEHASKLAAFPIATSDLNWTCSSPATLHELQPSSKLPCALNRLSIRGSSELTNIRHLVTLQEQHPGTLRELNLSHCSKISDGFLADCVTAFPRITTLDLTGCHLITDEAFVSLKKLPLTHLFLNDCFQVTDRGMQELQALPLTALGMRNCKLVTDRGMYALSAFVTGSLQVLDLRGCSGLSPRCVDAMHKLPRPPAQILSPYAPSSIQVMTEGWTSVQVSVFLKSMQLPQFIDRVLHTDLTGYKLLHDFTPQRQAELKVTAEEMSILQSVIQILKSEHELSNRPVESDWARGLTRDDPRGLTGNDLPGVGILISSTA
jgi:hypothetical protein